LLNPSCESVADTIRRRAPCEPSPHSRDASRNRGRPRGHDCRMGVWHGCPPL